MGEVTACRRAACKDRISQLSPSKQQPRSTLLDFVILRYQPCKLNCAIGPPQPTILRCINVFGITPDLLSAEIRGRDVVGENIIVCSVFRESGSMTLKRTIDGADNGKSLFELAEYSFYCRPFSSLN
ncbi:hypothetical protein J6590_039900 [Homalodisca vitripennis]|nr:hypothetical protein J6590_039900 [Homalodisca vitripennis]